MDFPESAIDGFDPAATVCVTGVTGYIGSWLVRSLLRRGYVVHAAARDIGKVSHLLMSWNESGEIGDDGDGRLKLFKADMGEEGSYDEAMKGCMGVFHVAASMEFTVPSGTTNLESYVRTHILEPAVRGTINVLKACQKAGSVRRVVFTSSISTITARDNLGNWKPTVDESSIVPMDVIWKEKADGWVYVLSKLLTEEAAFRFAKENGIDLVSIKPTTVAGPFLTQVVPASVRVLLSPITDDSKLYPILVAVHSRLGSISLVHIEDICNAHIFLMEQKAAEGRYICSVGSCVMHQLAEMLSLEYTLFNVGTFEEKCHDSLPSVISSNKLEDLGFKFKYGVRDIVKQSVSCCVGCGFLKNPLVIENN